jgi:hypothetical protein
LSVNPAASEIMSGRDRVKAMSHEIGGGAVRLPSAEKPTDDRCDTLLEGREINAPSKPAAIQGRHAIGVRACADRKGQSAPLTSVARRIGKACASSEYSAFRHPFSEQLIRKRPLNQQLEFLAPSQASPRHPWRY